MQRLQGGVVLRRGVPEGGLAMPQGSMQVAGGAACMSANLSMAHESQWLQDIILPWCGVSSGGGLTESLIRMWAGEVFCCNELEW